MSPANITSITGSIGVRVRDVYKDDEWQALEERQMKLHQDLEELERKYAELSLTINLPSFT